jgi:hypothetical protein
MNNPSEKLEEDTMNILIVDDETPQNELVTELTAAETGKISYCNPHNCYLEATLAAITRECNATWVIIIDSQWCHPEVTPLQPGFLIAQELAMLGYKVVMYVTYPNGVHHNLQKHPSVERTADKAADGQKINQLITKHFC